MFIRRTEKTQPKNGIFAVCRSQFSIWLIAFILGTLFLTTASAQTTNADKLGYLLLGGNYPISNPYVPNGTHAGIDYSSTGTNVTTVYSPLNGTITANTSACGKVAIYDGANTVILAHMDSRTSLAVGAQIKRGDYVGKAAAVVGGGCSASGSHLHIEVRTGNNPTMANPSSNNTATTINPANMFRYNEWDFNTNGDFQSWEGINVDGGFVQNGQFIINPSGADPHYKMNWIALNAATYKYVKTSFASNGLDSTGAIYFKTNSENFFSEDKKVTFTVNNCSLCSNAPYYVYTQNMSANPKWTGVITGIRLDPTGSGQPGTFNDALGIDYFHIQTAP